MIFYQPIKTPYFSNPEIMELTSLPSEINYKCSFYSLGVLVVLYLLNNFLLVGNEIKRVDEIENILRPIYNTKIYWFIKRCLEENIDKRVLLLI
jgi:serine/threonine protein kinase